MKKFLLSALSVTALLAANAAPTLTETWSKPLTGIAAGAVNYATPMAMAADGSVYASGLFSAAFEFAGKTLEPITAQDSYALKYNADGTEAWAVDLAGAVSISSVAVDKDDNLYVAGIFADEVEFGSTDGKTITKEGQKISDAFAQNKNAAFIAKYSSTGVVQAVETFVPDPLASLVATGMYSPIDGDVFFSINTIKVDGDKVYASAMYTGQTVKGDVTFDGSYNDPWGGVYYMDIKEAAVFSVNASDLQGCQAVATFGIPASLAQDTNENPCSSSLAVDNGTVYVGFVGLGKMNLTVGSEVKEFEFPLDATGAGLNTYGYVFASIKNGTVGNAVSFTNKTDEAYYLAENISYMAVSNGALAVVGTFNSYMPSDESAVVSGKSDVFAMLLSTADMSKLAAMSYAHAEANKIEEVSEVAVVGDNLYINIADCDDSYVTQSVSSVWCNATAGFTTADVAASGVASNGSNVALGQMTADGNVTYSLYGTENSGIEDVVSDKAVTVFPNPVVDTLNFSEAADAAVYTVGGALVKEAKGVESIDVSDLSAGLYIVKVGDKAVRVIKK